MATCGIDSFGEGHAEGGRFADPYMQEVFGGLFPVSNARNTRFAINFFSAIGLGPLTYVAAAATALRCVVCVGCVLTVLPACVNTETSCVST